MELQELVAKFTANVGLGPVPPVEGVWKFSADGNVFGITGDEKGETAWLFGEIPIPSPDRRDALLKAAMEANHFRRGTGGGTFSLNPDTGALTLADTQSLSALDEETFYAFIERFVNALATWNGLAAALDTSAPSAPPSPPHDAPWAMPDLTFPRV